uniref:Uncharacterized protein n=1 Tax=Chromera velia CCMP2878 TaxID=1169474 RepID=A0A0G4HD05_9ALVE|eukprot:Cvel_26341.t1-p1 / transcript=Cvel_26341.t1 / gene=Cvel_26341 / organism=Chromera_velia_CCMP2878 / gene_product=hypothetical protein / transcript_product=hypothetical protein / location=Cvel_scaffold3118:151-2185(+) / protein_length=254 / sequence_SO=supercontig / SO=protein_coding / is_pseudo=false
MYVVLNMFISIIEDAFFTEKAEIELDELEFTEAEEAAVQAEDGSGMQWRDGHHDAADAMEGGGYALYGWLTRMVSLGVEKGGGWAGEGRRGGSGDSGRLRGKEGKDSLEGKDLQRPLLCDIEEASGVSGGADGEGGGGAQLELQEEQVKSEEEKERESGDKRRQGGGGEEAFETPSRPAQGFRDDFSGEGGDGRGGVGKGSKTEGGEEGGGKEEEKKANEEGRGRGGEDGGGERGDKGEETRMGGGTKIKKGEA